MMQILLYDDKEMRIYEVLRFSPEATEIAQNEVPTRTIMAEISAGEVKAGLDPTTMKRIARYNSEKDFEELNKKIKSAEDKLKDLNKQVIDKEAKLEFMGEMIWKIWKDKYFDPDNYLLDDEDYCEGD